MYVEDGARRVRWAQVSGSAVLPNDIVHGYQLQKPSLAMDRVSDVGMCMFDITIVTTSKAPHTAVDCNSLSHPVC